jgi:hypothetical protein
MNAGTLPARAGTRFGWRIAAVMLVALAVAGCDLTGQYEANFQKAIQEAERRAAFDLNLQSEYSDAIDPSAHAVKLRLPKVFDKYSAWLKLSDPRAQVPFVALPDLASVLERSLDDAAQQNLGTYLYFAAPPKKGQKAEALQSALEKEIAAAFPGAKFSDVQISKPDGGSFAMKRLRVEGPQPFYNSKKKTVAKADGRFDLYYLDGGGRHILIAWRVGKGQAAKYQLEPAIEAAMGTVEITPTAAPADKKGGAAAGCFESLAFNEARHAHSECGSRSTF